MDSGNPKGVTIREVAALAGVSISSVSRYLTDPKSIRPVAAYNIKTAIAELKYAPNPFAQSLKHGSSHIIGIVVPHVECFFGKVCAVVSDYFYDRGYATFVCESDNDGEKERFFVQEMLRHRVSGLIVVPSGLNTAFLGSVAHKHKNMVILDRYENVGCDVISVDHELIAFRLMEHMLASHTCDEVWSLLGPEASSSSRLTLKGVQRALAEVGRGSAPLHLKYNCRNSGRVAEAMREAYDSLGSGVHPAVVAFGEDFFENAVLFLNQFGGDAVSRVDLAGLAMPDTLGKLGLNLPCVIKDFASTGIMTAETLFTRISDSGKNESSGTPQIYNVKVKYNFNPIAAKEGPNEPLG